MYQEIRDKTTGELVGILRLEDKLSMPIDESNRFYQEYLAWVAEGNTVLPDPDYSLEAVRQLKWLEVKAQRDSRKSGGVKVGARWFHSDADSRIQWLGLYNKATRVIQAGGVDTDPVLVNNANVMWKTMTGDYVLVTVAMTNDVVEATAGLDSILFLTAEVKRAAINASQTPETIDTTTGWNKTYEESLG